MAPWVIWAKGLGNCMISLVLNAQLHIEQVMNSELRGREKEIHLRQGHRWDRYDRQVGL